ncbi:MAG: helix-turn-helix domain-containing protein [Pyrinomonadaceae bacterium]
MAIEAKIEKLTFSSALNAGLGKRTKRRLEKIREMAAALLEQAESLDPKDDLVEASATVDTGRLTSTIDFLEEVRHFEIRLIKRALELSGGNQARAAELLGLRLRTFNHKVKSYSDCEEFRRSAKSIRELGFAGMWADREDIKDGVSYVNSLRDSPRA